MDIETIRTDSLAHLSYLVVDGGRAVVIDPRIDIDVYIERAHARDARITHVLETHRNEDLVSGARALSDATGAAVWHGPGLDFAYGSVAEHGQTLTIGDTTLEVLHTPGHTPESLSFALRHQDTADAVLGVFTGDALFVGDVGRVDLHPAGAEEAARLLHDSLHEVLLPLGDAVVVWPAHGAGSVCGDGVADRDFTTLGHERAHNPALALDREAFASRKAAEDHDQPPYFRRMEQVNLAGAERPIAWVAPGPPDALAPVVVDVRSPEAFMGAHVPRSLCLPLAMIGEWAHWWLPYDQDLSLVADDDAQARAARTELARIGYQRVRSRLSSITAWQVSGEVVGSLRTMDVHDLRAALDTPSPPVVVDVRAEEAYAGGHVTGAISAPLAGLLDALDRIPRDRPVVTVCGSGRRATIAASLLLRDGWTDVAVCGGSMAAWRALGLPETSEA
jgi:hydroxyacylglutathione hydrolase